MSACLTMAEAAKALTRGVLTWREAMDRLSPEDRRAVAEAEGRELLADPRVRDYLVQKGELTEEGR